jgi:uncharacterized repeat protein (TIGR03803 family)
MISPSGAYKSFPTPLPGSAFGPLVLASDGNFYGTTESGGTHGYGTVFRLSSSGTVKVIYNFDSTNGAYPYGGLVQGGDGNLYGTTQQGGANNNNAGTIFKLTLRGSITVLYSFNSQSSDGAYPFAGLVAGTDGNFYGTASSSTGALYGVVFEITPGGTYSVLYTFDDTHGNGPNSTAMGDTNGVIYGQTNQGGTGGTGVFWSLNKGILPFCSVVGFPAGTSGTTVEVLGQGFSNGITSIKFGSGTATSFTVVNDTYLTVKVPPTGTTGPINVSENGGATLTSKQTFDVLPVLTSFQPTSGPVGTPVTVTGSGFIGATSVTFNGVKATFTVNSATQITAKVPSGATSGKIKVTTPVGSATSSGSFTVT